MNFKNQSKIIPSFLIHLKVEDFKLISRPLSKRSAIDYEPQVKTEKPDH